MLVQYTVSYVAKDSAGEGVMKENGEVDLRTLIISRIAIEWTGGV